MVQFRSCRRQDEEDFRAVALTLELAQTVAVGPFNPHIITPEWLVRWKVLPDQEVMIRVAPVIDGAAFRFGSLEWQVDPRRLVVASSTVAEDCGKYVSDVLRLLCHTPVLAIGHNFHYTSNLSDWGSSPLPLLGPVRFEDLPGGEEVRWAGVFRREDARIEMTLGRSNREIVVLCNHHRNTDPRNVEQAQVAAQLFRHDYESSLVFLRELLGQEVSHV